MKQTTQKPTISFELRYRVQGCYDDGGWGHDLFWHELSRLLEAKSRLAANREIGQKVYDHQNNSMGCYCHRPRLEPLGLIKTTTQIIGNVTHTTTEDIPMKGWQKYVHSTR